MDKENPSPDDLARSMAFQPKARQQRSAESLYHTKSSQSESLGLSTKPSTDTGKALVPDNFKTPPELVPDWKRRRQMFNLKEKTLLKIYFSKWFYQGLEFHEKELLLLLCESQKIETDFLEILIYQAISEESGRKEVKNEGVPNLEMVNKSFHVKEHPIKSINLIGQSVVAREIERREVSLNQRGNVLFEFQQLYEGLLFSEKDFRAVWKLKSVQSLRDHLFSPFRARQSGKTGVKKPRVRGYTDGRGSSGDTRRTKMARQVDALFWEECYQTQWEETFKEMDKLTRT